jgi:hypothetical protein
VLEKKLVPARKNIYGFFSKTGLKLLFFGYIVSRRFVRCAFRQIAENTPWTPQKAAKCRKSWHIGMEASRCCTMLPVKL